MQPSNLDASISAEEWDKVTASRERLRNETVGKGPIEFFKTGWYKPQNLHDDFFDMTSKQHYGLSWRLYQAQFPNMANRVQRNMPRKDGTTSC